MKLPESHGRRVYLESDRQCFVAPPVRGQHGAEEVGAVGAHQLGGMIGDNFCHGAVLKRPQSCVVLPVSTSCIPGANAVNPGAASSSSSSAVAAAHLVHLGRERLQAAGRGAEAPSRARIYGNAHHKHAELHSR